MHMPIWVIYIIWFQYLCALRKKESCALHEKTVANGKDLKT